MELGNRIIYLKKLTLKYKRDFKILFNDQEMCSYLSIPYPITVSWIDEYITESMDLFDRGEKYTWGIFKAGTEQMIGVGVLRDIDYKNRVARIGYSTGRKYWNNGYTMMAVKFMLHYAFKELELNRIEVRVDKNDDRSIKLLEHIGGVREGILRQAFFYNGKYRDIDIYSILKTEYYEIIKEKKNKRGSNITRSEITSMENMISI